MDLRALGGAAMRTLTPSLAHHARTERGQASRYTRTLAAALMYLSLPACDTPPQPRAQATPVRAVRALDADSGLWSNTESLTRWRSVVRAGHVREVHETVVRSRGMQGTRVFEYDTSGVLRRVTERLWRAEEDSSRSDTSKGDTLVRPSGPVRESLVDFQADGPALASRSFGDRAMRIGRLEMRTLYVRGYALLDSARR